MITSPPSSASGRLGCIPVPLEAQMQDFGFLFETLMQDYEAVALALYRHDKNADVYYVYTGPDPDTALQYGDYVFFLAPKRQLNAILRYVVCGRLPAEGVKVKGRLPGHPISGLEGAPTCPTDLRCMSIARLSVPESIPPANHCRLSIPGVYQGEYRLY